MKKQLGKVVRRIGSAIRNGAARKAVTGWLDERVGPKPIMLKIETTNVCNALCSYCAYPKMSRPKEAMLAETFEKVVRDYSDMGGVAVTLTPVVGDALADPHFLSRFEVLARYPSINRISFTTNLIAHRRLSDEEWMNTLRQTHFLQVSLGGIDTETYEKMYAVNKARVVVDGIERLLRLKQESGAGVHLALAFRTDSPDYLDRMQGELARYKEAGVYLSNISIYGNWGGTVTEEDLPGEAAMSRGGMANSRVPCAVMFLGLGVLSSGLVTACSCCDSEGAFFPLGHIKDAPLREYWKQVRDEMIPKMKAGKLEVCRGCSMYVPVTGIVEGGLLVKKTEEIPLDYYRKFNGG